MQKSLANHYFSLLNFKIMKRLGFFSHNRAFLLPVILTVSLLLVALGGRPPELPDYSKPRQHHRAVVEAQVKVAKADQVKACKDACPLLVCLPPVLAAPAAKPTPFLISAYRPLHLTVITQLPSRGPPVFSRA